MPQPDDGAVYFGVVEATFTEAGKGLAASVGSLVACNFGLFSLVVSPIGLTAVIADRCEATCSDKTGRLKQVLLAAGVERVDRAEVSDDLERVVPGMREWARYQAEGRGRARPE